jgi:hypothetical protein
MKARKWVIYCGDDDWGNTRMEQLAREKFASDHSIDCITVYEHGGWFLSFNRDFIVIGTANDMAHLSPKAHEWARQFTGIEVVGYDRRGQCSHTYDNYWPRLAEAVA